MPVAFITSLNASLYHNYGYRYLEEFCKFSDKTINLYVVFEGDMPSNIKQNYKNIKFIQFDHPYQNKFLKYFGNLAEANGLKIQISEGENNLKKINFKFDFKFNAVRFSFKPFAIHQIFQQEKNNYEYLIWTDADLRCHKYFSFNDMKRFLPNQNQMMSYLGRDRNYSECGFLGFNLNHKHFDKFLDRIVQIYYSGEIFSLPEWHDSWIWDYVRINFEKELKVENKNISNEGSNFHHPFVNSGLEEFFDHLKGPERKKLGHSKKTDYRL